MSDPERIPIHVTRELLSRAQPVLESNESLLAFVELALKREISRRQVNRNFLLKGLAAAGHAKANQAYTPASEVIGRLQGILQKQATKKP